MSSALLPRELSPALASAFPVDDALATLEQLTRLDRYQASAGIERAADLVAETAERQGLGEVSVQRFAADGRRRWWTFDAPRSWTPVRAALTLTDRFGPGASLAVYPGDACGVAVNSAPTGPAGVFRPLCAVEERPAGEARGAILVPLGATPPARLAELAVAHGAAGFVAGAGLHAGDRARVRVELASDASFFAFSLDAGGLHRARAAAAAGGGAHATLVVDREARMPVVQGRLAFGSASGREEILLVAHLCHPGPAANDNGSGVVALLGLVGALATVLPGSRPHRAIRFLWAPEFAGTAAFLHQRGSMPPRAVVNLDMVGEDESLCGGPLVLEQSPDHVPSFLEAFAEDASDGLGICDRPWRVRPYEGTSDHALFADRAVARPAIQLGHHPDRFNHSSEDTLDKVDAAELRRCAAIGGAVAGAAATAAPPGEAGLAELVEAWAERQLGGVAAATLTYPPQSVVDPWAATERDELLSHCRAVGKDAVGAVRALAAGGPAPAARRTPCEPPDGALERRWQGPFNFRALLADASSDERALWASDRDSMPVLVAVAHAIDGRSAPDAVLRRAAYARRRAFDRSLGEAALGLLLNAGWAAPARSAELGVARH